MLSVNMSPEEYIEYQKLQQFKKNSAAEMQQLFSNQKNSGMFSSMQQQPRPIVPKIFPTMQFDRTPNFMESQLKFNPKSNLSAYLAAAHGMNPSQMAMLSSSMMRPSTSSLSSSMTDFEGLVSSLNFQMPSSLLPQTSSFQLPLQQGSSMSIPTMQIPQTFQLPGSQTSMTIPTLPTSTMTIPMSQTTTMGIPMSQTSSMGIPMSQTTTMASLIPQTLSTTISASQPSTLPIPQPLTSTSPQTTLLTIPLTQPSPISLPIPHSSPITFPIPQSSPLKSQPSPKLVPISKPIPQSPKLQQNQKSIPKRSVSPIIDVETSEEEFKKPRLETIEENEELVKREFTTKTTNFLPNFNLNISTSPKPICNHSCEQSTTNDDEEEMNETHIIITARPTIFSSSLLFDDKNHLQHSSDDDDDDSDYDTSLRPKETPLQYKDRMLERAMKKNQASKKSREKRKREHENRQNERKKLEQRNIELTQKLFELKNALKNLRPQICDSCNDQVQTFLDQCQNNKNGMNVFVLRPCQKDNCRGNKNFKIENVKKTTV